MQKGIHRGSFGSMEAERKAWSLGRVMTRNVWLVGLGTSRPIFRSNGPGGGGPSRTVVIDPSLFSGPALWIYWLQALGDPNAAWVTSDGTVFMRFSRWRILRRPKLHSNKRGSDFIS